MTNAFKALSALLSYPTAELKEAAGEIGEALAAEPAIPKWTQAKVQAFLRDITALDLYELQERYVFLFDRTRSLSLHLFEHVHGESRDRGQAMVDLRALYENAGLDIGARELPDYLPLFLEFLSTRRPEEARALLQEPLTILAALRERLDKRRSPYAAVFRALEHIAGAQPAPKTLDELRKSPDDDPNDFAALDAAWNEAPVEFGPSVADCVRPSPTLRR
jgi:nitrate reductase delta subunit